MFPQLDIDRDPAADLVLPPALLPDDDAVEVDTVLMEDRLFPAPVPSPFTPPYASSLMTMDSCLKKCHRSP